MKKLFKYAYVALVGVMVFALNACTNDYEYDPASKENLGEQVYFSNNLGSKIELPTDGNSFTVNVCRVNTEGELTVPITVTMEDGSIFRPETRSVTFADGQDTAPFVFTFDPEDVVYGKYSIIKMQISDETYTTPYGLASYSFEAGKTAWVAMKGKATYREDIVSTWYGLENPVYQVSIEENIIEQGVYRLVDPYGTALATAMGMTQKQWASNYDYNGAPYYMEIDASDPNYVYVRGGETGLTMDAASGMISGTSIVDYYMANGYTLETIKSALPQYFGKLEDGVITMPTGSMLISEENYNNGGWYTANRNGLFAVALPGASIKDYSFDISYIGRFTDVNDNDYATIFMFCGENLTSVKYALVPATEDVESTIEGIIDGSVECSEEEAGPEVGVSVPYEETNTYNFVVVLYEGSEVVGYDYFELKLKSSKDAAEQYEDIGAGVITLGAADLSPNFFEQAQQEPFGVLMGQTITQEAVISQSTSDPTHYKIEPFYREGYPLFFTWDSEANTIVVDGVETGLSTQAGVVYATDVETAVGQSLVGYGLNSCYLFDDYTFRFNLMFNDVNNTYACETETYEITEQNQAKVLEVKKKIGRKRSGTGRATLNKKGHKIIRKSPFSRGDKFTIQK